MEAYNPDRNGLKQCKFCDSPVAHKNGSSTVGLCDNHYEVFMQDCKYGLHKRNRLKDLMEEYHNKTNEK